MINELVVATHNQGKVEEFKVLMKDLPIEIKYLADFDVCLIPFDTSTDLIKATNPVKFYEYLSAGKKIAANARQKATYYAKKLGKPCIADDSGLEVQALDGAPGVRSARYAGEKASDEDNNNLLLHNMKFQVKRTCRFRCALCVAQPDGKVLNEVDGICDGMLLHEPLGENGFGYDPLFWSTELHKGMAEATMQEKNKISHRGKAIRKLVAIWSKKK